MSREVARTESKEYPPDRNGNIIREEVSELAGGAVHREGGIEEGPEAGRRWSKWDEKEARPIPDAPAELPLWYTSDPTQINELRARRYGFITEASENGGGPLAGDAWLHAEADVEVLPVDPFSAEALERMRELSAEKPTLVIQDADFATTYRRHEHEGQIRIEITRVHDNGTKFTRGEHITGDRKGSGWITREAPVDTQIVDGLELQTDDGSRINSLQVKKSTFNFGTGSQNRLYVEFVGRRESES
ncbi:MAG: hypothetical protein H6760_04095 [Candidatus Nomurabacteria bacterium]|nr:MAG: hypothetical protein H6760_04095 [Candidatus Nomurabacteria bacterium]